MNYREIDQLLMRYLEGETSLGEEQILKDFFSRSNLPDKYKPYVDLFRGFKALGAEQLEDHTFNKEWSRKSRQKSAGILHGSFSFNWYLITGIAATLFLAVVLFVPVKKLPVINLFSHKIEDTFDDPRKAYAETVKALLMVSEKFSAGTHQMKDLNKLDKGLNEASKMLTFNKGIREMSGLGRLEEVSRPLGKLSKVDKGLENVNKLSKLDKDQIKINNL